MNMFELICEARNRDVTRSFDTLFGSSEYQQTSQSQNCFMRCTLQWIWMSLAYRQNKVQGKKTIIQLEMVLNWELHDSRFEAWSCTLETCQHEKKKSNAISASLPRHLGITSVRFSPRLYPMRALKWCVSFYQAPLKTQCFLQHVTTSCPHSVSVK